MRLLLTLLLLTTTLPAQDTPKNLGVLLFPGFELLDATGPLEVWGNLKDRVKIVTLAPEKGPVTSSQGITLIADHALTDTPPLDLLLVPGGFGVRKLLKDTATLTWLKKTTTSTPLTMSVCNGASLLAATGLLDGRPATTNKAYWTQATKPGPKVNWIRQARWIDDGTIVTSSGVTAGIDMTLHIVARLYGQPVAQTAANQIEHIWHQDPKNDPFAAQ